MVENTVIYQLALRTFTDEGTLKSAAAHLDELKELGIDIIYLTACFKTDKDDDRKTWSPRQIASGCNNPSNPYKMADYFSVDEEYGNNDDLHEFINRSHELGLRVMLDLVYLHCGRNAVFLKEHPDYVIQNEDGTPKVGEEWPFARINYANEKVREYLYENGEFLVKEFNIDGFRCDVGDGVPLDFWREFAERARAINKNLIMLNEGTKEDYLEVFDFDYGGIGCIFGRESLFNCLFSDDENKKRRFFKYVNGNSGEKGRHINFIENHDIATDNERAEKRYKEKMELMLFLLYIAPGIPFIWNGNEYADDGENCMFSNRKYGKRSAMNRELGKTEKGKARFDFVKKLNEIYHSHPVLANGKHNITEQNGALFIDCENGEEKMTVVFNPIAADVAFDGISGEPIISHSAKIKNGTLSLSPYGFVLFLS